MFDLKNLAVQSYCFRNFKSVPDLIAKIRAVGLSRTELCGVHVDFNDESSFEGVLSQFKMAGIQIASIGVQEFHNDPSEEKWFRFAKSAGAKLISCTADISTIPGSLILATALADKYDLLLGIHNHGGYDWLGNSTILAHVMRHASPRIGLCLDTAWCLQAGEDPVKWAERFHDRLYGVHIKDFVFDRAGKWSDVVVGRGNLKLKEILKLASSATKMAAMTLEYEGDPNNPVPALKECIAAIQGA
jgi:inosose dehydratase